MKSFSLVLSLFLVLLLTPHLTHAAQGQENLLESVSYKSDPGQNERIRFHIAGKVIPEIFTLGGENPRVILDFFNTLGTDNLQNKTEVHGELVKSIRVGKHLQPKKKIRVVVDMQPEVSYQFTKQLRDDGKIFELTIQREGTSDVDVLEGVTVERTPDKPVEKTDPTEWKSDAAKTEISSIKEDKKGKKLSQPGEEPKEIMTTAELVDENVVPDPGVFSTQPIEEKKIDITLPEKSDDIPGAVSKSKGAPRDAKLLDVSFEDTSNKGEMVLFKLNGFYPPIVFGVEKGNPKVVCDFLDTSVSPKVESEINSYGRFIKSIKVDSGNNSDKVRVTLSLMENKNYDLQQVFFKEDNLFVLIVDTLDDI